MLGKDFDGLELSGGQWQKLALSRVLYREPNVYILDEPTSAIDALAEEQIFNNLHNLPKDKTLIFVSHRFSTIKNADRIIVLSEGSILEQGTHLELMQNTSGLYKQMYEVQIGE
jgi:ATP-binding cassette, subfamily B, bacterial